MEPAVFRPVQRRQAPWLVAGALGGTLVGALVDVPLLLAALFGAVAAAITSAARHVTGQKVVASPERLALVGGATPFEAPWDALRLGFGRTTRPDGGALQRFAIVADPAGGSFAFGDFGGQGPCDPVRGANGQPVEVIDLDGAPFLLALLVQRVPAWHVLPAWLTEWPAVAEHPTSTSTPTPTPRPTPRPTSSPTSSPTAASRRPGAGLVALVLKLGSKLAGAAGKLGAGAVKAVKTTNLGWAAASAATYSILFSWQFAAVLLLQLFVHEYGHVHAMRRTGMRVRGMYFIPFFGALAVSEDAFTSRRQQAYVALAGPLWGGLLTLLPLGLYLLTGQPFWATTAAWWALINLFNLLPITPLDGGRALNAFANSFSSGLGLAVGVLGLAGAVALGTVMGFSLIWLVALVGAVELVAESQARAGGRALRLLPEPARFSLPQYQYLRGVLGPPLGSPTEAHFARDVARVTQAARIEPMRPRELLAWGLAYAGLAAALLALLYFTSHVPDAAVAAGILS